MFREVHLRDFGDDQRETYWLPPDLWTAICAAEAKARGITSSQAREWLTAYRGCVGTELYEFAAGEERRDETRLSRSHP